MKIDIGNNLATLLVVAVLCFSLVQSMTNIGDVKKMSHIDDLEKENESLKEFFKYVMDQLEINEAVTDTVWVTNHPYLTLFEVIHSELKLDLDTSLGPVERTRIEFEKWYKGNWGSLEKLENGNYAYQIPQTAWESWKAAKGIKEL